MSDSMVEQDWLKCAKWLMDCGAFKQDQNQLRELLKTNRLTFNDFANCLRDGIVLCNLLNQLIPACIDTTQINNLKTKQTNTSQLMCLKNINLFLLTCKSRFNLNEQDLFEAHMLYNLESIECVIKALSTLSRTKIAEASCGRVGFHITHSLDDSSINDIYYNISPLSQDSPTKQSQQATMSSTIGGVGGRQQQQSAFEAEESYYTPDSFILNNDTEADEHENIYQAIINKAPGDESSSVQQAHPHQQHDKHKSFKNITKKDHVIREIYDSELRFVNTLIIIVNDFLKPLQKILSEKDRLIVFVNIEILKELHYTLFNRLKDACTGGHGRTTRICLVFDTFKQSMIKEYVEYFAGMQAGITKFDSLLAKGGELKQVYEELRKKSEMRNFKLSDLLRVPYQRVLKYHLLFNEINKHIDDTHEARKDVQQALSSMNEMANYLNEAQRHKDILDQIDKLSAHLNDFTPAGTNTASIATALKDYGHLIKDDSVRIKFNDERTAKTRTLLLFDKAIFICKSKGYNYYYKETILINDLKIQDTTTATTTTSTIGGLSQSDTVNSSILGGIHNQFYFTLINSDKTRILNLYFKNDKQKHEWKTCILNAIDRIQPNGYTQQSHLFILWNFERDIVQCGVCKKVLCGVFYQGYKCDKCSMIAHKPCLTKCQQQCTVATSRFPGSQPQQQQQRTTSTSTLTSLVLQTHIGSPVCTASTTNGSNPPVMARLTSITSLKNLQYRVKALYAYNGRPIPPYGSDCAILKFNDNDSIIVTDDDDDEWWKGFKLGNSIQTEGYFPKSYVYIDIVSTDVTNSTVANTTGNTTNTSAASTVSSLNKQQAIIDLLPYSSNTNSTTAIEKYSWYANVDRERADLILNRIPQGTTPQQQPQAIFLVRPRQEGDYAISIKFEKVEHIKIHTLKFSQYGKEIVNVCLVEQKQFTSILELVQFYMQNTLEENFPQLRTSLGTPFREALPLAMSTTICIHDYDPKQTSAGSTGVELELKKGERLWVLSKDSLGWWKVFNIDGLIGYAPGAYLQEV